MSSSWMGLVIGGFVPAVGYALFAIFTKSATQAGIGPGANLAFIGLATALVGMIFHLVLPTVPLTTRGALWATGSGILWAAGTGLVSFALMRYGIPVAKLNPIYNTNTLLAVVLGLVIFSEWKQVDVIKLSIGAVLILAGSLLVARA
ncbi:MAG: hypothetical protein RL318_1504 [Fibrobacterota bacterium]